MATDIQYSTLPWEYVQQLPVQCANVKHGTVLSGGTEQDRVQGSKGLSCKHLFVQTCQGRGVNIAMCVYVFILTFHSPADIALAFPVVVQCETNKVIRTLMSHTVSEE